jgi:pimeloyl-ACP methyl ester carboxylesterase
MKNAQRYFAVTVLLALLLSLVIVFPAQAQSDTAYIIVHAHNPEGVEINSIDWWYGSLIRSWEESVQIYDGDNALGPAPYDTATHGRPIAISPGTHVIKAKFNGMTLEQEINIPAGATNEIVFTFEREEVDTQSLLTSAHNDSWYAERIVPSCMGQWEVSSDWIFGTFACYGGSNSYGAVGGSGTFSFGSTMATASVSATASVEGLDAQIDRLYSRHWYNWYKDISIPPSSQYDYWLVQNYIEDFPFVDTSNPWGRSHCWLDYGTEDAFVLVNIVDYAGNLDDYRYYSQQASAKKAWTSIMFYLDTVPPANAPEGTFVPMLDCSPQVAATDFTCSSTWSFPVAGGATVKMSTVPYDLVGTGVKEENQPPVINIVDAKMVSPNELGIGVSVTYPTSMPSNALKSLTVQATINGQPVTKTFDITQLKQKQMFNNKGVLLPTTPLRINLKTEGVPRFTDNVKFTVTAVASYEGSAPSDPKPCDVKVLLPIVVIHGYEFKITKNNWVFHLFAYKAAYKSLSDELINQGYSHSDTYGKTKLLDYRTLWDPRDSVAQYGDVRYLTEAQILQMMNNVMLEVNEHSYASKVNLVGHSFGGLIARDYAAKHSSNVNTVITVGTPHLGTTGFYDSVLKHYHSVEGVLLKIPADRIVYWTVPTYENALIYADGSQAYNLFPNTLAGVGMANGVNYFCIYSDSNTQTTRTLIVQNSGTPWYTIVGRQAGLGDGYIPAISAGNIQFGEPIRLQYGGNHASLMNEIETQLRIQIKLMQFN